MEVLTLARVINGVVRGEHVFGHCLSVEHMAAAEVTVEDHGGMGRLVSFQSRLGWEHHLTSVDRASVLQRAILVFDGEMLAQVRQARERLITDIAGHFAITPRYR